MIYAWTGKNGSGKTFDMVNWAYRDWRSGVNIWSNTILLFYPPELHEQLKNGFSIEDYPGLFSWFERLSNSLQRAVTNLFGRSYAPISRGRISYFENISEILEVHDGLILFDEAQVLFNARQWESLPSEFQYKLQQHRKHRLDLYCTTQNMGTIDITYRRLVQHWIHCSALWAFWGFQMHAKEVKDIDMLYNLIDDLKTPSLSQSTYFITPWSRRLYDTYYDIGFKRFRTLWLSSMFLSNADLIVNENDKPNPPKSKKTWMIIPKTMSLKDALAELRSSESLLNPGKSANSKSGWKNSARNF